MTPRARTTLITAAVGSAGLALGAVQAWPHLVPKNFGTVAEGRVYRSGELTVEATRRVVDAHHIRTIIDLGAFEPGSPDERRAQATADALGVDRWVFRLEGDATGDPEHYIRALNLMADPARQPVLVHCSAGAQRTSCAVAMYRHAVEGLDLDAAYAEARKYRHEPRKNPRLKMMIDTFADDVAQAWREGVDLEGEPLDMTPENAAARAERARQNEPAGPSA